MVKPTPSNSLLEREDTECFTWLKRFGLTTGTTRLHKDRWDSETMFDRLDFGAN